jgi:hypothetical protein
VAKSALFGLYFIITVFSCLASATPSRAQSIEISPGPAVTLGTTTAQQFTATALDGHGVPLATRPSFIWSVASGGVGSIDYLSGLYHSGRVVGTATVKVRGGGLFASAQVTVSLTPVTVVNPASATPDPAPLTITDLLALRRITSTDRPALTA